MDQARSHVNPSPINKANPLSKLFFSWLDGLMYKGYKRTLEPEELYNIQPQDGCEYLSEQLEREWNVQVRTRGHQASLMKAIWRTCGIKFMLLGLLSFSEEATRIIQPLFLGQLIRYFFSEGDVSTQAAYLYALGISLCVGYSATVRQPYGYLVMKIGMKMRIAVSSMVYKKALNLSYEASKETSTGNIVNLMTNDVNRFESWALIYLHHFWIGPVQAVAVLVLLWTMYGLSSLAGYLVLAALIPLNTTMSYLSSKYRSAIAETTDERVKVVTEILNGIRVIKMYCWEYLFSRLYGARRSAEMYRIVKAQLVRALSVMPSFNSNQLIVFTLILTFVLNSPPGTAIQTDTIFVTMALINPLWRVWTLIMPAAILAMGEIKVSFNRVRDFLLLGEFHNITTNHVETGDNNNVAVRAENVKAAWEENQASPTLDAVTFNVREGELMIVIGQVGSGKSSLLMSLLSEIPVSSGSINLCGSLAYVAQTPWIFSASVRQNIIMNKPYKPALYNQVIKAACLERDFAQLTSGDQTLVGEHGLSLSGGQKARVALARAFYAEADIYLLDDPLSAVDPAVSRKLFHECQDGFLKDKTTILVTHQLQYTREADKILILNKGKISGFGSYDSLTQSGLDLHMFVEKSKLLDDNADNANINEQDDKETAPLMATSTEKPTAEDFDRNGKLKDDEKPEEQTEEERQEGSVGFMTYMRFFWAGGGCVGLVLMIVINLLAQGSFVLTDWYLSYWSELQYRNNHNSLSALSSDNSTRFDILDATNNQAASNQSLDLSSDPLDLTASPLGISSQSVDVSNHSLYTNATGLIHNTTTHNTPAAYHVPFLDDLSTATYLYIYAGLVGCVFLFGLFQALFMFALVVRSSRGIHKQMFHAIIRSPTRFFDTNPVGRILNRFSKDTGLVDEQLPFNMYEFIKFTLMNGGTVLLACIINPWVLIPTFPLLIFLLIVRKLFLTTSRQIRRLEATARSPLFSHVSTSLEGVQTIRSLRAQGAFISDYYQHQDNHTEAYVTTIAMDQWFSVRLEWLCVLFITATSMLSVYFADNLSAGLVGLTMVYAINLMGLFQWAVRQSATVENQMVSVERIIEYGRLPPEAPLDNRNMRMESWPAAGAIKMNRACLQYDATLPLVLKDITIDIKAREKIGIVGRTGAGKSSLVAMMLRLAEPTGTIQIDNVDIKALGLHKLRGAMSVIPQDPTLFKGTVRKNLDPFNEYKDAELWRALEEVEMKSAIASLQGQLEAEVTEGGSNFSVGQRQLLCLCRAVLRRHHILIMDEATANVDTHTDALIQRTLRRSFSSCTVLTIAHRIITIADSDRVMVMDNKRVIEFDSPYTLLNQDDSRFHQMVRETGEDQSRMIKEKAYQSYMSRAAPTGAHPSALPPADNTHLNTSPNHSTPTVYSGNRDTGVVYRP